MYVSLFCIPNLFLPLRLAFSSTLSEHPGRWERGGTTAARSEPVRCSAQHRIFTDLGHRQHRRKFCSFSSGMYVLYYVWQ
ncbi:hypothetical protein EV401DRAFT_1989695 [Pisolithus croceorrhizus]|nr:hypothetical protein EV401DRAFT_1989695 [Pisolithus croceorrhizus]